MPEFPAIEFRTADARDRTVGAGTETWHSFSYGAHYDPDNIAFGPIIAINEERIAPGEGYDEHRHEDVEIVTWVLEGTLAHADSTGRAGDIGPGLAQRLSAGSGVTHAERNASDRESLRFVQMMLRSRNWDAPEYAQTPVPDGPGLHETVPVNADATLFVARPTPERPIEVPGAAARLLHVTRGPVEVDGLPVETGGEVRTDDPDVFTITGATDTEVLVWFVHGSPQG